MAYPPKHFWWAWHTDLQLESRYSFKHETVTLIVWSSFYYKNEIFLEEPVYSCKGIVFLFKNISYLLVFVVRVGNISLCFYFYLQERKIYTFCDFVFKN